MAELGPIVCSFHTPDDYYTEHARRLRRSLDRLGIEHDIRQVDKRDDQDWADVCRRKVPFLYEVCNAHPGRRVFWIDVDCQLLSMPAHVRDSTADLIGFQRGFGSPLGIGYARRARFWEPCFFGIGASARGRRFIADAAELERASTVKATDDYFFEEAWRANAAQLAFQVIPSVAVVGATPPEAISDKPFFLFGSSGNVADFKDKVTQHEPVGAGASRSILASTRTWGLRAAKKGERLLPARAARTLRRAADSAGITGMLTGGSLGAGGDGAERPARQALLTTLVARAQAGDLEGMESTRAQLRSTGVTTDRDRASLRAAESFAHYATCGAGPDLRLSWWPRPSPGNFGDWLSPMLMHHATGRSIRFEPPTAKSSQRHLVALGSIARFAQRTSTVVGTGVSSLDVELAARATWISVRGPLTAQALRDSGGPRIERFGDPGVLIRRAVPLVRGATNGRTALVRHYRHLALPVDLPDGMDELSVLASHPDDITALVTRLNEYDRVVTSAMHIMIACHSYGIPCALVTFEGLETAVPGSGVKYEDYALGVGITGIREPVVVSTDLATAALDDATREIRLADDVLDDVEDALASGVAAIDDRLDQRRLAY